MKNLYHFFQKNLKHFPNKPAICIYSSKEKRKITYKQMEKEVYVIAKSLVRFGVKKGDRIAIFSENRYEWYISLYAIFLVGAVVVPLYATASKEQLHYIIKDSNIKFAFVSKLKLYEKIAEIAEKDFIKTVLFDFDPLKKNKFSNIVSLEHFKDKGIFLKHKDVTNLNDYEEEAVLIYTSGTTGEPKGVVLTHKNIISNVKMLQIYVSHIADFRYLSLLPLSHAYEFTVVQSVFSLGGTVIPVPNPGKALDYISNTKPTVSCAVPRLFEKIYNSVLKNVEKSPPMIKMLFHKGLNLGEKFYEYIEKDKSLPFPYNVEYFLFKKIIFDKIKNKTIKSIELFISGGAPLMQEIASFFNILGTTIIEGYGITECSPVVAVNMPNNRDINTIGEPLSELEVKIDKNGELLVKGDNVMKYYHNKPKETAEVLDENGYFHTGDIAIWTDNGKLRIIGRKKDLIVMANGKNIAPQKIENRLKSNNYIDSACVVGDNKKYLSALIVPDFSAIKEFAKKNEFHYKDIDDLLQHPAIVNLFDDVIKKTNSTIESYESIKRYKLLNIPFSIETGELTPTLKLRRKIVLEKYDKIFQSMY